MCEGVLGSTARLPPTYGWPSRVYVRRPRGRQGGSRRQRLDPDSPMGQGVGRWRVRVSSVVPPSASPHDQPQSQRLAWDWLGWQPW